MKILFPTTAFYPSQIGGPCNTIYWHACALTRSSLGITTVTTTAGIPSGRVVENEYVHLPCGLVYYGKGSSTKLLTLYQIFKNIKTHDLIHLNSLFSNFSIFTFFLASILYRRKKVVWSVRGELNRNALNFSSWKKRPVLYFYKRMVKNVVFHSTSDQESNDIKKMFPKSEVIQIPNLLKPNPRFDDVQTKKELLFIGRIHPIKAIHKLIEGLSQSEEFLNSGFKLNIVGKFEARHEDYYRSLLSLVRRFMLEDRVLFLGHVEGSAKERLYAQSYFTILPSETENFGNVVVESLNQGTPVIASFGTPWAILEENGCGYHVSNSVDALTNVINRALKLDQEEYLKKRENAYALIDKQFDIDKQIHRWLNQYKLLYNV